MTCNELQQDLALAAARGLDEARLNQVREHVRTCAACAARLRSYETVCAEHVSTAAELEALPILFVPRHSTKARSHSVPKQPWRWLIPIAGIGTAAAVLFLLTQKPGINEGKPLELPITRYNPPSGSLAVGSLARYRIALEQNGEKSLDSLLARDADVLLRAPSRNEFQQLLSETF